MPFSQPMMPNRKLIVVKLDQIGDYVLFRNFLEVLRNSEKYGDHELTLLGNKECRELAESLDSCIVDRFIWLDKPKFVAWKFFRKRFLGRLRRMCFDVLISPLYSRENCWTEPVVEAVAAKEKIGSVGDLTNITAAHRSMADEQYTRLLPARPGAVFEFLRNREFFEGLLGTGIALKKPSIEVASSFRPTEQEYAVLFPGAKEKNRRWPEENFACLADYLVKRHGLAVVVCGSRQDRPLAARIARLAATGPIKNMCGRISLGELPAVFSNARIVVANDTSAHHIAVAAGARIVCLSNGNTLGRFAPYPPEVNDQAAYAFPPEIEQGLHRFDELVQKYRYASRLDMRLISVDRVKDLVDESLKPSPLARVGRSA